MNPLASPLGHSLAVSADVPTESLARVAAVCVEAGYAAGEALYRENEAADRMFVILEGAAAVARHGGRPLQLGPGKVLGALGMLARKAAGT